MPTTVRVSSADLPISCPRPADEKWNLHPRVFLPLSPQQPALACPYCGTKFELMREPQKQPATPQNSL